MISKPIKLTAFRPKFAVLNQSITLASCRGQEESQIYLLSANQQQLQPFSGRKYVYDMENLGYKFVLYDRHTSKQSSLASNLSSVFLRKNGSPIF